MELFGARVAPLGEETLLVVHSEPVPNAAPVAALTQAPRGRNAVTVSAAASSDSDGEIVEYVWDFGDGTSAEGRTADHTYAEPGSYTVTLAVKDDRGAESFTTAQTPVEVSRYAFEGFLAPVKPEPGATVVAAGQSLPLKFRLGGDEGLGVIDASATTSRRVDCKTGATTGALERTETPGLSRLSYDSSSATYTYVWQTAMNWRASCRTFLLALDDGSTHELTVRVK